MSTIFPSLLGADPLNLGSEIEALNPHCLGYHLDIMDNHFVPNQTWGPQTINAIAKATHRQLWTHLMVDKPTGWVNILQLPPGSIFTFHIESEKNIAHIIKHIKEKKWIASVAISPKTDLEEIFPLLEEMVGHVLVMSVEPGFSGQEFIPESLDKVEKLTAYRASANLTFKIGIDGGVNKDNIATLGHKGIDDIAISKAIFSSPNHVTALKELQNLVTT